MDLDRHARRPRGAEANLLSVRYAVIERVEGRTLVEIGDCYSMSGHAEVFGEFADTASQAPVMLCERFRCCRMLGSPSRNVDRGDQPYCSSELGLAGTSTANS